MEVLQVTQVYQKLLLMTMWKIIRWDSAFEQVVDVYFVDAGQQRLHEEDPKRS